MVKIKVEEKIFYKYYEGLMEGVPFGDIPKDLLPTDTVCIELIEAHYSDNNSWEDHTNLVVYRSRLETDKEFKNRKESRERIMRRYREITEPERRNQYLELKKEFENVTT